MKHLAIFLLFIGMFLIVHSIYEEKIKRIKQKKKIEYRFIPRTLYEEQMSPDNIPTKKLDKLFS